MNIGCRGVRRGMSFPWLFDADVHSNDWIILYDLFVE